MNEPTVWVGIAPCGCALCAEVEKPQDPEFYGVLGVWLFDGMKVERRVGVQEVGHIDTCKCWDEAIAEASKYDRPLHHRRQ